MELDVHWGAYSALVSSIISCKAETNLILVEASPEERVLLVVVSSATEARSLSVAVARLAMASTVSCWYIWLADWKPPPAVVTRDSRHS